MAHWLMKSEPGDYSIDDLARDGRDWWTGIRNYQSRNFMRDTMKIGDEAFFYHSSCPAPGIFGLAQIAADAVADETQFDKTGKYYDGKATPTRPRWFCVQIAFVKKFAAPILLSDLRNDPALSDMLILRPGNRLSITPLADKHWRRILRHCI